MIPLRPVTGRLDGDLGVFRDAPAQRRKLRVTLVRGPFVSTMNAASNEATPALGPAYVAGYLRQFGYDVTIVDSVGEDLNKFWTLDAYPGLFMKGLTFSETIDRIPPETDVIGFSAMFSAE